MPCGCLFASLTLPDFRPDAKDPTLVGWVEGPASRVMSGPFSSCARVCTELRLNLSARMRVFALLTSRAHESAFVLPRSAPKLRGHVAPPRRVQQLPAGHGPGPAGQSEHRSPGGLKTASCSFRRFSLKSLKMLEKPSEHPESKLTAALEAFLRPGREESLKLGQQGVPGAMSSASAFGVRKAEVAPAEDGGGCQIRAEARLWVESSGAGIRIASETPTVVVRIRIGMHHCGVDVEASSWGLDGD